jgi:hypothetical protein
MPEQYQYQWIDLDEYYHKVNGLNSIGGTPEELREKWLRYVWHDLECYQNGVMCHFDSTQ